MKPNQLLRHFLPALSLAFCAHAAFAQGVTLFEHEDFRGKSETFTGDVSSLEGTIIGNDRTSSILVDPGCEVTLFEDSQYRGRSQVLTRDAADLNHLRVRKDSISSIRVSCRPSRSDDRRPRRSERSGVTVYSGADYYGAQETFDRDDPYLVDNPIGNDKVRSMRVPPGCEITVYEHEDYGGRSFTLRRDNTDLTRTQFGPTGVSSLRIRCDDQRGTGDGQYRDRREDHRHDERGPSGVTFYRDTHFAGTNQTFTDDRSNMSGSAVGNDSISSVRIDPGCRVILFKDSNFRGRSTVISNDISDLRGTEVGNDSTSSFRIDCSRGWR